MSSGPAATLDIDQDLTQTSSISALNPPENLDDLENFIKVGGRARLEPLKRKFEPPSAPDDQHIDITQNDTQNITQEINSTQRNGSPNDGIQLIDITQPNDITQPIDATQPIDTTQLIDATQPIETDMIDSTHIIDKISKQIFRRPETELKSSPILKQSDMRAPGVMPSLTTTSSPCKVLEQNDSPINHDNTHTKSTSKPATDPTGLDFSSPSKPSRPAYIEANTNSYENTSCSPARNSHLSHGQPASSPVTQQITNSPHQEFTDTQLVQPIYTSNLNEPRTEFNNHFDRVFSPDNLQVPTQKSPDTERPSSGSQSPPYFHHVSDTLNTIQVPATPENGIPISRINHTASSSMVNNECDEEITSDNENTPSEPHLFGNNKTAQLMSDEAQVDNILVSVSKESQNLREAVWVKWDGYHIVGSISSNYFEDIKADIEVEFSELNEYAFVPRKKVTMPFDLKIGDLVKSRINRKLVFKVKGLYAKTDTLIKDSHGNDHAILRSITCPEKNLQDFEVSLDQLYMTNSLWNIFLKRRQSRVDKKMNFTKQNFTSSLDSGPTKLSKIKDESGVFSGCLFTFTDAHITQDKGGTHANREDEKIQHLRQAIIDNGGIVLNAGLHELFTLREGLEWNSSFSNYKFGAVLSCKPSRTPKYLEALALGWPCLSWKYIEDCMQDPEVAFEWFNYLLPSGVSKRLGGIAASQKIYEFRNFWENGFTLKEQFASRRKIFNHVRVPIYLIDNSSLSNLMLTSKGRAKKGVSSTPAPLKSSGGSIFFTLLLMMGCDPELLDILADAKSCYEAKSLKGAVVIHNCGGRNPSDSIAEKWHKEGKWMYTEDKKLLRNFIDGKKNIGVLQYSKEWVVQCIVNGCVV